MGIIAWVFRDSRWDMVDIPSSDGARFVAWIWQALSVAHRVMVSLSFFCKERWLWQSGLRFDTHAAVMGWGYIE
jgi:hypothetical protein